MGFIEGQVKLELTDKEWMSIISQERDGLPVCCANISELRDVLIGYARGDGERSWGDQRLKDVLTWCFPEHGEPTPVIQKVIDQLGWAPTDGHESQLMEMT